MHPSMDSGAQPLGRPPRPLAGLPGLDDRAVAKAWLVELMARSALEAAPGLPVGRLAQEGPALCAAAVAALGDDEALAALRPGGARAGVVALLCAVAAGEAGATVAAVDALRATLTAALRPDEVAAGERLAHVCAQITLTALSAPHPAAPGPDPAVTVQDLRPAGSPVDALARVLRATDGPVAVLAAEVDDLDRLLAAEDGPALTAALQPMAVALGAVAPGELVTERPGRWWLLVPGPGTEAARTLAAQAASALAGAAPERHGAPLTASIGLAVAPDDGTDPQALADHADQGVFTARALGVPVA